MDADIQPAAAPLGESPPGMGLRRLPRFLEPPVGITALFLLFVFARYVALGARRSWLTAIRVEFALGLPLVLICVGMLMSHPLPLRNARHILMGISLLFLAVILQVPFAADPFTARTVFYDRVVKFACLTFFMTVLIQSPRTMRWFMLVFLISCLDITAEAVRGLTTGGLVWENQGVMRLHGSVPIYQHPNSLGGLAMGAIPFAIFLLPVWRRWWERAGLLLLLGTSVVCVLYTGSRTAYVAFVGFLFYWWVTSPRKARWMLIALALGAASLAAVPQQYKGRFESIFGQEKEGHSKEARIEILSDAWAIFLEHPGGVGVASFPTVRMQKFSRMQDTHNLYLEVATNLGVQGLLVFGYLIWAILQGYRRVQRGLRRQQVVVASLLRGAGLPPPLRRRLVRHRADLRFLSALCRAAAGFLWVRLVLGLFGMDLYEIYWWFAAGMAISLLALTRRSGAITDMLLMAGEENSPSPAAELAPAR